MNRVDDPADPERCQGNDRGGQCWNRAEVGSDYCMGHNGGFSMAKAEDLRLYHLTEARNRQRLAQLSEHDPVLALREVIALARRLVERRVNLAQSDDDLIQAFSEINALQITVQKVVTSALLIEQNLDVLLGKATVFRLGQLTIQIVANELSDVPQSADIVKRVADQIIDAIATANNHTVGLPFAPVTQQQQHSDAPVFKIENTDDKLRLAQLNRHERIKSLNEDIALQIMLIERRWNMVKNDEQLISACGHLNSGLRTLLELIKSAHQIEQTLGQLLTADTVRQLGATISQIIVDELELADLDDYEARVDRIMDKIKNGLSSKKANAINHVPV